MIWLSAFVLSYPSILVTKLDSIKSGDYSKSICTEEWPSGYPSSEFRSVLIFYLDINRQPMLSATNVTTQTFSTCHVCQIPVNQCVSESQNDYSNINVENITDSDTDSRTRILFQGANLCSTQILNRAILNIFVSWILDNCKEQFSRSKLDALRKNPCFCPKPGKQNLVRFLNF